MEDDLDDQEFIIECLQILDVKNVVHAFDDGREALSFLKTMKGQPFMIISDVNLPVMNGLQLKAEIQNNEKLRAKSIPFIFLSTSADAKAVEEAFKLSVQGFFVKENTFEGIKQQLKQIIDYWKSCKHPNFQEE